jgi:hypothetical protein
VHVLPPDDFFCEVGLDRKNGVVYYEAIKRELYRRLIYEGRCDERLKAKAEDLHASHTLGCAGNWNTKDRDDVTSREVCECDA